MYQGPVPTRWMKTLALGGAILAVLGSPVLARTQPKAAARPAAKAAPVHAPRPLPPLVTMDQMDILARSTEYDGQAHTYSVKGDVKITLRDMVVTCDQATIYATPKEDRVDRIVFAGGVEAKRGAGVFRGEQVTYFVAQRRLLAEGGTRTRLLLPASGSLPIPSGH